MSDPLPDGWERAYAVLSGEDKGGISFRRAAEAAGVSVGELRSWIRRSREQRVEDEEWVHEIATQYDGVKEMQAGVLEDVAWDRALHGTPQPIVKNGEVVGNSYKHDNNLLMSILRAKDENYREKSDSSVRVNFDLGDLFLRYQSVVRLADADNEKLEYVDG